MNAKMDKAAETSKAVEDGSFDVPLRRKVTTPEGDVDSLKFREPTGSDIERCGVPVIIDLAFDPPRVTFDEKKMISMLSTLAAQAPSVIKTMHPKDLTNAMWGVASFFVPGT